VAAAQIAPEWRIINSWYL